MIERRTMRSPINGVVVKIYRDECEAVSPSSPGVLNVVQLNPLRANFTLPTDTAVKLNVGQTVSVEFPDTGKTTAGVIEFISPITDAESGTVRVKVVIENPKEEFRSGVRCLLPALKSSKPETKELTKISP
jgi:multidrug efflux pump subunit AcrA (membrane-fusion protein)